MDLHGKLLAAILCVAGIFRMAAVPANPKPYVYVQPDGSKVLVYNHGDEYAHYLSTADGVMIMQGDDGYLRYAVCDADGMPVASEQVAHDREERTAEEQRYVAGIDRISLKRSMDAAGKKRAECRLRRQLSGDSFSPQPVEGQIKGLIVLANFLDMKFDDTQERIARLMNESGYGENGATGSARDYFIDQSGGKFMPDFDVVGPVELDMPMKYYGGNVVTAGNDRNPDEMIFNSVKQVYEQGLIENMDVYDRDGDGTVDMVYVIYAGLGEADGGGPNTVWPHMYSIEYSDRYRYQTVGGKRLGLYACSAERRGDRSFSGIGTFCHEFGHCLGLPDMYDVDYSGGYGMKSFSIMGSGSYLNDGNTPPNYNSFERCSLGWLDFQELSEPQLVFLEEIGSSNAACRISTGDENEFFTLENRQRTGWDAYLESEGLMILHIDYDRNAWDGNSVNDDPTHQRVRLMCADNDWTYHPEGDLYPGTSGNTAFSDTSKPSSQLWSGADLEKPVTEISVTDGIVRFNFMQPGASSLQPVLLQERVRVSGNCISITLPSAQDVAVYGLSGRTVCSFQGKAGENLCRISVPGLYLVVAGKEAAKVSVGRF